MNIRELKEEIITRVPPKNILNHYGIQETKGRYTCPFHNDTNPSMTTNNILIRCWSCMGESINVIDFVMRYEGLNFIDAIKVLSDIAGLERDSKPTKKKEPNYFKMIKDLDSEINQLYNFKKSGMVDTKAIEMKILELTNKKDAYVELLGRSEKNWDF